MFETGLSAAIVYLALGIIFPLTHSKPTHALGGLLGFCFACGVSFALRPELQFGGTHRALSIASFALGVNAALAVLILLLTLVLRMVLRPPIPARACTVFLAGLAAHTGWHRMLERSQWLSTEQMQWPVPSLNNVVIAVAACLAALLWYLARRRGAEA